MTAASHLDVADAQRERRDTGAAMRDLVAHNAYLRRMGSPVAMSEDEVTAFLAKHGWEQTKFGLRRIGDPEPETFIEI